MSIYTIIVRVGSYPEGIYMYDIMWALAVSTKRRHFFSIVEQVGTNLMPENGLYSHLIFSLWYAVSDALEYSFNLSSRVAAQFSTRQLGLLRNSPNYIHTITFACEEWSVLYRVKPSQSCEHPEGKRLKSTNEAITHRVTAVVVTQNYRICRQLYQLASFLDKVIVSCMCDNINEVHINI